MHFIEPINRAQVTFGSLEDLMTPDNPVRLIDAFDDRLDLKRLGFGVREKAPPHTDVFDDWLVKRKKWNPEPGKIVRAFFQIDLILSKMTMPTNAVRTFALNY
jgi:hypothetical protein